MFQGANHRNDTTDLDRAVRGRQEFPGDPTHTASPLGRYRASSNPPTRFVRELNYFSHSSNKTPLSIRYLRILRALSSGEQAVVVNCISG